MSRFVDSSFLFAIYTPNQRVDQASRLFDESSEQLVIAPLVIFEFHQAVWHHVFRLSRGEPLGFTRQTAESALAAFEADLEAGRYAVHHLDFGRLIRDAMKLVLTYTARHGIRSMDILHLAAAKQLGCTEFLTFDKLQRRIAELEGFTVPL